MNNIKIAVFKTISLEILKYSKFVKFSENFIILILYDYIMYFSFNCEIWIN